MKVLIVGGGGREHAIAYCVAKSSKVEKMYCATVAIDGGANAAILAAKILATSDPELLQKLKDYTAEMKETVQKKAEKLEKIGHKEYIKQM